MTFMHKLSRRLAGLPTAAAAAAVVIAACEQSAPPALPPEEVAQLVISPKTVAVEANQDVTLMSVGLTSQGDTAQIDVTWTANGGDVTDIGAIGGRHHALYRSATPGTYQVWATAQPGGKSDTASITVTAPPPPGSSAVFVGAGDISGCSHSNDEATAQLLDGIAGTVFTAGDNVYPDGTDSQFAQCYDPTWGRHKARTRPSPGNHDYHTTGAAGYYAYFGANAGPSGQGYYSYDLGAWHIISLNSNISMTAGSAQEQWLRADLAASSKRCTLAYWHHPRFSSGSHGSSTASQPLWQALYDHAADVIIVGHDHNYQRFAPQTPSGVADPMRGIRQFVAGMGGQSHYNFGTPIANTEAYNTTTYGVLKLTLFPDSYTWEFVPVAGATYTDSGSAACH